MSEPKVMLVGNVAREVVRETMDRLQPQIEKQATVVRRDLECNEIASEVGVTVALVVGGDGSILKAARCLAPAGIPCMGVNIGRLGFLAAFREDEVVAALPEVLSGGGCRVTRIMFSVKIEKRDGHHLQEIALNDVVVGHAANHRMIGVEVDIGSEAVATYHGDGVIVATPTGSTAYNLAAGGPIIESQVEAMVITPICPHMLTHRSIVIGAQTTVTLRPTTEQRESNCIIDGQTHVALIEGDVVHVRLSPHRLILIHNSKWSSFETLREKLHWSTPPQYVTDTRDRNK
jgi:NAD+ kinase